MAESIYLRPSADISLGNATVYVDNTNVTSTTPGYTAISEEVCDEDASHIRMSSSKSKQYTSTFLLRGNPSSASIRIIDQSLYGRCKKVNVKSGVTPYLDFEITTESGFTASASVSLNNSGGYFEISCSFEGLTDDINAFISQNHRLPEISIILTPWHSSSNTTSSSPTIYLSQLYIELTTEDGPVSIGIHHKVNGEWVAATAAYQKQNGAWVAITADEAKSIIQNSFCTA